MICVAVRTQRNMPCVDAEKTRWDQYVHTGVQSRCHARHGAGTRLTACTKVQVSRPSGTAARADKGTAMSKAVSPCDGGRRFEVQLRAVVHRCAGRDVLRTDHCLRMLEHLLSDQLRSEPKRRRSLELASDPSRNTEPNEQGPAYSMSPDRTEQKSHALLPGCAPELHWVLKPCAPQITMKVSGLGKRPMLGHTAHFVTFRL